MKRLLFLIIRNAGVKVVRGGGWMKAVTHIIVNLTPTLLRDDVREPGNLPQHNERDVLVCVYVRVCIFSSLRVVLVVDDIV